MDIIDLVEEKGYSFIHQEKGIYIFQQDKNYVFIDPQLKCIADSTKDAILLKEEFIHYYDNPQEGFALSYTIPETLPEGSYKVELKIDLPDLNDDFLHTCELYLEVGNESKNSLVKGYEKRYTGQFSPTAIYMYGKQDESVSADVKTPVSPENRDTVSQSILSSGIGVIEPKDFADRRYDLNFKTKCMKDWCSGTMEKRLPEEVIDAFKEHKPSHESYISASKEREQALVKMHSEARILFFNSESGNMRYHNMISYKDIGGQRYTADDYPQWGFVSSLNSLPNYMRHSFDKTFTEQIVVAASLSEIDINKPTLVNEFLTDYTDKRTKETTIFQAKEGMTYAYEGNDEGTILNVEKVSYGEKSIKVKGKSIKLEKFPETHSSTGFKDAKFHKRTAITFYREEPISVIDPSIFSHVETLRETMEHTKKVSDWRKNSTESLMVESLTQQLMEDRMLISFYH